MFRLFLLIGRKKDKTRVSGNKLLSFFKYVYVHCSDTDLKPFSRNSGRALLISSLKQ